MRRQQKRSISIWLWVCVGFWMGVVVPLSAISAPYADMVMDARTGKVLSSENADTRLHPASLTKMMTLYIAFEAIENGEISANKKVRISRKAASEPPSKLGLREGQRIELRYLIRAAAVKSANDAATAIGEAIEGSEAAFARRMNRTAKALGMTRSTFKNAHGLTEKGHLSTARDMTILGRHLFYDYPDYYHLFSRVNIDVGSRVVPNTNRRFLNNFKGADGIKTGYTNAAGFNLVASAERGNERIIATVFGGRSTKTRNDQVAKLLNYGFKKAPSKATVIRPDKPNYASANKIINTKLAVSTSLRPRARPNDKSVQTDTKLAALDLKIDVAAALTLAHLNTTPVLSDQKEPLSTAEEKIIDATLEPKSLMPEVVTRISASGGRDWAINVGLFTTQYAAEKMLLKTALAEMSTLDGSLRKVVNSRKGFEANFVGLSEEAAERACQRLLAKNVECETLGPN